jgi:hypothetical protein
VNRGRGCHSRQSVAPALPREKGLQARTPIQHAIRNRAFPIAWHGGRVRPDFH